MTLNGEDTKNIDETCHWIKYLYSYKKPIDSCIRYFFSNSRNMHDQEYKRLNIMCICEKLVVKLGYNGNLG